MINHWNKTPRETVGCPSLWRGSMLVCKNCFQREMPDSLRIVLVETYGLFRTRPTLLSPHITFPQDLFCTKAFNSTPIMVLSHLNFATFSAASSMASSGNNSWIPNLLLLLITMLSSSWTSALFSPHHTVTSLHFSPHSLLCCSACISTKAVLPNS